MIFLALGIYIVILIFVQSAERSSLELVTKYTILGTVLENMGVRRDTFNETSFTSNIRSQMF